MQKTLIVLAIIAGAVAVDPKSYNLYVSGNFSCSNSDTEGRVAAGGNVNLNNYAINCMTYSTNGQCIRFGEVSCAAYPEDPAALVVGGDTKWTNGQIYAGSYVHGGSSSFTNVNIPVDCAVPQPQEWALLVKAGIDSLAKLSTSYALYEPTGTTTIQYGGITLSTLNRYAIFNVQASDLASCNGFTFDVPTNAKLVLVNVIGDTAASMSNFGIFGFADVMSKIMWNFPTAATLTTSGISVRGAVLAPRADIITANGVIWGQVYGKSFSAAAQSTCAQINLNPFTGSFPPPPSPPAGTCGDSNVDVGEDCDGGVCCTSNCQFLTSTTVCRPSAGFCDIEETCSGVASICPVDAFKPITTPCGSNFGVCDVQMVEHCPGNASTCKTSPGTALGGWDAFNVISFDSYTCHGGDVEGRLAVRNQLNVSGFTIGLKTLASDPFFYYELVVAGDATYTDGSVNKGQGVSGEIVVRGEFTAPEYLQAQLEKFASSTPAAFDDAQFYYTSLSNKIASLGTNAQASLIYGDGLTLTCDDVSSAMYIVQVPTSTFNKINWYVTSNCKLTAAWLITLTGTEDVNIMGAPFPGVVERVVYNIQGTRTVYAINGVAANILAPNAQYTQNQGVTYGKVIVGNVTEARQNNKPECLNFRDIEISQKNLIAVKAGDDFIYVYDLAAYIPGDLICANGECHKVVSGVIAAGDDGATQKYLMLASAWSVPIDVMQELSTVVSNPTDESRSVPLPIDDRTTSGASALTVSMLVFIAAISF